MANVAPSQWWRQRHSEGLPEAIQLTRCVTGWLHYVRHDVAPLAGLLRANPRNDGYPTQTF